MTPLRKPQFTKRDRRLLTMTSSDCWLGYATATNAGGITHNPNSGSVEANVGPSYQSTFYQGQREAVSHPQRP